MNPLEPRHGDNWVPTVSVLFFICFRFEVDGVYDVENCDHR